MMNDRLITYDRFPANITNPESLCDAAFARRLNKMNVACGKLFFKLELEPERNIGQGLFFRLPYHRRDHQHVDR